MPSNKTRAIDISLRTLREWPLPLPNFDSDKELRGHVLVVAGSRAPAS
jgi:NAD(P)H-hydrate repair Nnr-like enzyme with NAD(P)H-hydrate dehydratase domain